MSGLLVGIMGAGQMAQGFDKPGDRNVLSLAHAVSATAGLRLGGFFDRDVERAEAAEIKWGCPATPRGRADWLRRPWDIVCIATPDEQHSHDLRDVIGRKPKAILVEKPLAMDPDEGRRLLQQASDLGIPVLVDFPRRFHSGVSTVSKLTANGTLGRLVAATFVYSGEAARSAVHMLDLFHTWWGNGWSAARKGQHGNATLIELSRGSESVAATFMKMSPDAYYVWEMTAFCTRGKIELSNSPETLSVDLPGAHPLYPSFEVLTRVHSFGMEDEPLLCRTFEALTIAASDGPRATTQFRREAESQEFSGRVLHLLSGA